MKKNLTELVFILDKSGSMAGLESDTIGGYNAMLQKQKAIDGECVITTVLFDNRYELLHDRIDIRAVKPITDREYCVGGSTALLDAIGKTIHKIGMAQKNTSEDYRAEKVMFVIITDGQENASREYSLQTVRHQIERQKERYGWEFIFLGANMDAVTTAGQFGISANRAADYVPDGEGTELNFRVMSEAVASFRACGEVPEECLEPIWEDVQKRKGSERKAGKRIAN
ncbi:MAG: VWA domain-containing protein [Lachnospiraceae bacterium]|nr:VWA domain-containing protein [Lachnospiraceae bacterium]